MDGVEMWRGGRPFGVRPSLGRPWGRAALGSDLVCSSFSGGLGVRPRGSEKRDRSDIDKIGGLELASSACREPRESHLVEWCSMS